MLFRTWDRSRIAKAMLLVAIVPILIVVAAFMFRVRSAGGPATADTATHANFGFALVTLMPAAILFGAGLQLLRSTSLHPALVIAFVLAGLAIPHLAVSFVFEGVVDLLEAVLGTHHSLRCCPRICHRRCSAPVKQAISTIP